MVTNTSQMNSSIIGIAIATGGGEGETNNGLPTGGDPLAWTSSGAFSFDAAHVDGGIFRSNSNSGGGIPGAIQWIGMATSGTTSLGDIITYKGGTIGGTANVQDTFEDGYYDTYLINGFTGISGTSSGIPEPAVMGSAFGLTALLLARRRAGRGGNRLR